ncbi:MAG: tetratricopeptide repeat protein [Deltaproteobacteria bacterium]|nr:MAG: tetratricopeptide repeat protein [Deltaproteobacteria bacterium]
MNELSLSENDFRSFRDLIAERSGIYFEPEKQELLKDNLLQRMADCGLSNFAEYFNLLLSPACTKEFDHLLNLITIPETHFFRDRAQFRALERFVIPEIVKKKSYPGASLRIWSAGCSTGEEPYTIAMILAAGTVDRPIQILATDVSQDALKAAREGIYTARSVRDVPQDYLNRFFIRKGNHYLLDESIKQMVEFRYFNLVTEPYPLIEMSGWDIIFCRNVTIYFQAEATRKVIHNFYRSLREGGYLFAGYSESLRYISDEFDTLQQEGAFFYRKGVPKKEVRKKDRKIRGRRRTTTRRSRKQGPKAVAGTKSDEIAQICARAKELLERGKPQEAGEILSPYLRESSAPESILLLQAEIALNQGELEKAVQLCERIVEREPLSVAGHYLLGVIYLTWEDDARAMEEFKKVLYLQPEHALARFNLGDLYSQVGQFDEARLEYANVVRLLKKMPESLDERFAGGFSPAVLIDTCLSRIRALENKG